MDIDKSGEIHILHIVRKHMFQKLRLVIVNILFIISASASQ